MIGWEHEIRELSTDAVLDFYRRWYHPANAVLVVAGDVNPDDVRQFAEQTYGLIAARPVPAHLDLIEPPQKGARRVVLADERVRQPAWSRSYLAPSVLTAGSEHTHALQVLAEIVGGGATSLLYRDLVLGTQSAVSASAWYDPNRRGPSRFVVAASPWPGVEIDAIEDAIDAILGQLLVSGVEDSEVERAKRRMLAESVYARDSLTAGAHLLGEAVTLGIGVDAVERWPERIAAITKAEVDAAARAVLVDRQSVTSVLLPKPLKLAGAGQ